MFVFHCCTKPIFKYFLGDCNLNDSVAIPENREQVLLFEKEKQQQQEEAKV